MEQLSVLIASLTPVLAGAALLGLCRWRTVAWGLAASVTAGADLPGLVRVAVVASFGLLLLGDLLALGFGRNVADDVIASLLTDAVRFLLGTVRVLVSLPGRLSVLLARRRWP
jgi:hypothetical protein